MLVNIQALIDDAKCFETVRDLRWPDGVRCPECDSAEVVKDGRDDTQPQRQRYQCRGCGRRFDDLTGTIFAGHHQPLRVWVLCLYFMGLNLSNEQIAQELGIDPDDAQVMATAAPGGDRRAQARGRRSAARSSATRSTSWPGTRAIPRPSEKRAARPPPAAEGGAGPGDAGEGEAADLRDDPAGRRGRHPDAGRRQAGDDRPADQGGRSPRGAVVYTDEYDIYARLPEWGYTHQTVCHAAGEFARDDDGDGFCEVHVNTLEGFWSLLRSWLRPHRGISQERLPLYLGFFEFVHNVRRRGKALLGALVGLLLKHPPETRMSQAVFREDRPDVAIEIEDGRLGVSPALERGQNRTALQNERDKTSERPTCRRRTFRLHLGPHPGHPMFRRGLGVCLIFIVPVPGSRVKWKPRFPGGQSIRGANPTHPPDSHGTAIRLLANSAGSWRTKRAVHGMAPPDLTDGRRLGSITLPV